MSSPRAFADDWRHAFRTLRRDRSFTLTALAILTLGIGANTAVFSIVSSVLLRPLAYRDAGRLVLVEEVIPQLSYIAPTAPANGRHYVEWKNRATSFESVALLERRELNLTGAGEPERLSAAATTSNYFEVLGVKAALGRTFTVADEGKDAGELAILTNGLWQRNFGGDPAIVGKTIRLNGVPHTVIGVLPAAFRDNLLPAEPAVYLPWRFEPGDWGWAGEHNYPAIARLRPDVTVQQATAEMNVIQADIAKRFENVGDIDLLAKLTPLGEVATARVKTGLWLLLGAVGAVLLVACVNLSNLMLVRATGRGRESAIRTALGAPAGRLFRTALFESLQLALAGAAGGVGVGYALVEMFRLRAPIDLPRAAEVSVDGSALLFSAGLAIVTAAVMGLLPAARMMRSQPMAALRSSGRSATEGRGHLRVREMLVSVEVGLAVTLLVVAGLLIASFWRLGGVDPGFRPEQVLTAEASLPDTRYPDAAARRRFWTELTDRLERQPGITAAGVISVLPLRGRMWTDIVTVEGETRPILERPILSYRPVTADYFRAMGMAVRAGRSIEERDHPRKTAVVSQSAADRLWPGANPIGKRFWRSNTKVEPFEVVGVVADIRNESLRVAPEPMVYVPLWERAPERGAVAVRSAAGPRAIAGALREALRSLDPEVPLSNMLSMTEIMDNSVAQQRFQTMLVLVFAGSALLLAGIGIYSVLAYSVARRTGEIGIRMALGAQQGDVLRLVLRQGMGPVAVGLAMGVAGALAVSRLLASLLFGVSPTDAATYACVGAATLGAALLACLLPARRAIQTVPLEALRYE